MPREKGVNIMSRGGGVIFVEAESISVDVYHMCSQSTCFSLHHVASAKKGGCWY